MSNGVCLLDSSKLEPVIWLRVLVTLAYMKGRTDVRTDVHDVMAIKPNFLTSMNYHIFLTMVLRARARGAPLSSGLVREITTILYQEFLVPWHCCICKNALSSSGHHSITKEHTKAQTKHSNLHWIIAELCRAPLLKKYNPSMREILVL